MSLIIRASTMFQKRYLKVDSAGVRFYEAALFGSERRFAFEQIVCVLMSEQNVLSFQVGNEVFSLQTKPHKRKHQDTIAALLGGVQRSVNPH